MILNVIQYIEKISDKQVMHQLGVDSQEKIDDYVALLSQTNKPSDAQSTQFLWTNSLNKDYSLCFNPMRSKSEDLQKINTFFRVADKGCLNFYSNYCAIVHDRASDNTQVFPEEDDARIGLLDAGAEYDVVVT